MSDGLDSIAGAASALRSGATTSAQLVEAALACADRHDAQLGVFLRRFDESALAAAQAADDERRHRVDRGPLHGIPVAVKDVLAAREGPTTAQSEVLPRDHWTGVDSTAVARLRDAGAIVVGKTTTMEFAVGYPGLDTPFPLPRNPWDTARWAGGSSSGSASGVAAGIVLGAVGTDTGGSIRCPAAFCGVAGMKPSYGLVPTTGCYPLAPSMDHVGPLARGSADLAALMDALTGDSGSAGPGRFARVLDQQPDRWRVGVLAHVAADGGCDDTKAAFDAAVTVWEGLGSDVVEVRLPLGPEVAAAASLVLAVEGLTTHLLGLRTSWERYFATTRDHLLVGGAFDAIDYVAAQRLRDSARAALRVLFESVDVIVGPTITGPAPTFAAIARDGIGAVMGGRGHTNYWNAVGNPVVAAPMGFTPDGLPLSMQIAAPLGADERALQALHAYESMTAWHHREPTPREAVATASPPGAVPARTAAPDIEPTGDAWASAQLIVERIGVPASTNQTRGLAIQLPRLHQLARLVTDAAAAQ